MKKLILISLILLTFSCRRRSDASKPHNPLYHIGEIVYIKPDSVKAVINDVNNYGSEIDYDITYSDSLKILHDERGIREQLIFDK